MDLKCCAKTFGIAERLCYFFWSDRHARHCFLVKLMLQRRFALKRHQIDLLWPSFSRCSATLPIKDAPLLPILIVQDVFLFSLSMACYLLYILAFKKARIAAIFFLNVLP